MEKIELTTDNNTLGDQLPAEIARVRDEVMLEYLEIGNAGAFALAFMRASLDRAAKAMAEGDVVAMIASYKDLRSYSL